MEPETIEVRHARVHNLRSVSMSLPRRSLIVFTGVSGSGKSSLAFDTLYAEGQRRYVESLSSYARQFMGQMEKPDCDLITGLSPAVAIEQKTTGWNPRSTVGTITAIHDFLRVLYARVGVQHCTGCGKAIRSQSREEIVTGILEAFGGTGWERAAGGGDGKESKARGKARVMVLAPMARGQKGEFRDLFEDLIRAGYARARVDGEVVALSQDLELVKNQRHSIEVVIDRIELGEGSRVRLGEAVEGALRMGEGTVIVAEMGDRDGGEGRSGKVGAERVFSSRYGCADCGVAFEAPSPQLFSFNSPTGMCMKCGGLGEMFDFDEALLVPDGSKTFWGPCIAPMRSKIGRWRRHIYEGVASAMGFDLNLPWRDLPKKAREVMLNGAGDKFIKYSWKWSGGVWRHGGKFEGVVAELREKYRKAKANFVREYYEQFMRRGRCPDCGGGRLNKQAAAVRLRMKGWVGGNRRERGGRGESGSSEEAVRRAFGPNLTELCGLSIEETRAALDRLELSKVQGIIAEEALKELRTRLDFLIEVGLGYVALERTAPSLSGGELQRIRLAASIGSGLTGVLYVLDEPSIGLHHRDNDRLLASLKRLRDMGNTVIVVEHDEATMRAADHLVDFGPGPGVRGGRVVAEGSVADLMGEQESVTGKYLCGKKRIEVPENRRRVDPMPVGAGRSSIKRTRKQRTM